MAAHSTPSRYAVKEPQNLSPRIQRLRDYYFQGVNRKWNNEFTAWTTGTAWDFQYPELSYYIVPETYAFLQTFRSSFAQAARRVTLPPDFGKWSLAERRAWFLREVMVRYLPQEILPGDLIAGGRFNVVTSACMSEKEAQAIEAGGRPKARGLAMKWFHDHGYGNAGATSGHLIPDYPRVLQRRLAGDPRRPGAALPGALAR